MRQKQVSKYSMPNKIVSVSLSQSWGKELRITATLDTGEKVIIEDEAAMLAALVERINERGYTLSRAPRQEYQRLTLI